MKTVVLALAALSLAACGPRTEAGNTDTLTIDEEGDAGPGNSDAFEATGRDAGPGNDAGLADNVVAPEGNTR